MVAVSEIPKPIFDEIANPFATHVVIVSGNGNLECFIAKFTTKHDVSFYNENIGKHSKDKDKLCISYNSKANQPLQT